MKRASPKQNQANALQRAEMIMKVRCGLMTASEAANQLGVSRKTYYKWERRGLAALLEGVGDQKAGRPKKPDRESALEKRLAQSQAEDRTFRAEDSTQGDRGRNQHGVRVEPDEKKMSRS